MTSTLDTFNSNHELIKEQLTQKNLDMIEYPIKEWQKMIPTEQAFAYCSGHILSTNLTMYSIFDEDLFYSLLFPDYSDGQLKQLKSLFAIVKSILTKTESTYNNHHRFMFAHNSITASTHSLSIIYKNNQHWLSSYSTVSLEHKIALPDLSFETLYTVILNDFNEKVGVLLENEEQGVNLNNIAHLQTESHADYIQRMHKGRIVNAITVEAFQKHVTDLNLSMIPIKIIDVKSKTLKNDSIYLVDVFGSHKFSIGIQKLNKLKMMLSPLMNESDTDQLIQLLSIAQFYSKLLHPSFDNDCIELTHCDLFKLSKEALSSNPNYIELSIGIFEFEINDKIKIENYMDDDDKIFSTLGDAYAYLSNYIQQNICNHLDNAIDNISNKDLLVLDMLTC